MVAVLSGGLTGCAPRGETKSVQQVLEIAQNSFKASATRIPDGALKQQLISVTELMEGMLAADGERSTVAANAAKVSELLVELGSTAGYTTRPALAELVTQHRVLGNEANSAEVNSARVKLLVARTYGLLSSELETTKFAVLPLLKRAG